MPTDGAGVRMHRYLALDALRGAAAFAVLFYHLHSLHAPGRPGGAIPAFASGYLAVDVFFLLSGFVIAHAYGERLRGTLSLRQFMIARFVRLQPVIAVATLIGFALALGQRLAGVQTARGLFAIVTSLPANLLMLPNVLVPWGIFLFNPPAWSLFYELVANAIYAFGIRRCAKTNAANEVDCRMAPALAVACIAGMAGLTICVACFGNLDKGVVLGDAPCALSRIAFSFTLGLLIHRSRHLWMHHLPRLPMPCLLVACLALLAPDFKDSSRALYDMAFVVVLSPALVMLTAVTEPCPRLTPAAAWLGMISYPLYALHAPIKHLLEASLPLDFVPLLIASFCTITLAAWLMGTAIDPALRRWLGARLDAKEPDAHGAPTRPSRSLPEGT